MTFLFIDEIHRLSPVVEEILYPALEDFQIDILIGEGPAARSVKLDLQPFTLVGATTRAGMLTNPLRGSFWDRFKARLLQSGRVGSDCQTQRQATEGDHGGGGRCRNSPSSEGHPLASRIDYYDAYGTLRRSGLTASSVKISPHVP